MECVERAFASISHVQRVPLSNTLRNDKDYSDPIPGIEYDGRWNICASQAAPAGGRTLLLNTHVDTVPPAQGQIDPFVPTIRGGSMFGRGACDAKGQVATIWLAMAAMKDLGIFADVRAHLVVEEENGGNGSLGMVRAMEAPAVCGAGVPPTNCGAGVSPANCGAGVSSASCGAGKDAGKMPAPQKTAVPMNNPVCVVLEPTDLKVLSSIRGAVWFRIMLTGRAGHSGQAGATRSALKMAIRVVEILEGYHARLLAASRGQGMFDKFPNPMPLTVGHLEAGNWPATAPSKAVLEGVLGLLPNKTARQVMDEMTAAIVEEGGPDIAENFTIHFTYRHDSSVCPADHPLVTGLLAGLAESGSAAVVDAMTASCDAWLYNNQLNIPTVVFGGGSLSVAHSAQENMPLSGLAAAATVIANFAAQWCGSKA